MYINAYVLYISMEKRKVIKLGPSSYAITLPASWVDKFNIADTKTITLVEHNGYLSIHPNIEENNTRQTTIEFSDMSLKVFNKLLISHYLKNYSRICILGEEVSQYFEQIKQYVEKLPHLEIVSINDTSIILEDSSRFQGLKIEEVFTTFEDVITCMISTLNIQNPIEMFTKMQILDKSVNKAYFKSIKALNYHLHRQEDFEIIKNSVYVMKIVSSYEIIGDNLKRISRYVRQHSQETNPFSFGNIVVSLEHLLQLTISYRKNTKHAKSQTLNELNTKKMTILREIDEKLEESAQLENYQLELVVFQLIKDILGSFDEIITANIDAYGVE